MRLAVQMCSSGGKAAGSSRLGSVTSTSLRSPGSTEVRDVPQLGFCQGSRQLRWMWPRRRGDARSCGFEEAQHGRGPAKEEQSAAVGGDRLVVAGAETEEVAELVVTAAEPGG